MSTDAGTGGVVVRGQGSPALSGTKYNGSAAPVVVRFGLTAGSVPNGARRVEIGITEILNGVARWYTDLGSTSATAMNIPVDVNPGGSVIVLPTPGVLSVVLASAAWASRRRRVST